MLIKYKRCQVAWYLTLLPLLLCMNVMERVPIFKDHELGFSPFLYKKFHTKTTDERFDNAIFQLLTFIGLNPKQLKR